jgi:hypothetical protein
MIWEIDRAPAKCDSGDDTTAYYVNKNATPILTSAPLRRTRQSMFSIINGGSKGIIEIRYSVPSSEVVNLELFNMKGALVQNLAHGIHEPGKNYTVSLGKNDAGISIKPGAYVVNFATPASTEAGMVVVK